MRWLAACLALIPGAALAHASERMVILTLPTGWYMLGAGIAVALTALAGLMAGRLPGFRARVLFERRAILSRTTISWLAAFAFWSLIATGIWGTRDPLGNLLPLTVWTVLWVGLTLASILFGNLWRDIEPWTGPARTIRHLMARTGNVGLSHLCHWPAVAGYLGFAWFEIVSLSPADPLDLARVAAGYYLLILALAVLEGEDWLERGEFMTVYFAMVSRIAPFWAEHEETRVKTMAGLPGAQILRLPPLTPSAIAFVTLVLASVSFDGLTETFWWLARLGINPLEFPGRSAVLGVNSAALLAFWTVSAALILGAIRAGLPHETFRQGVGAVMLSFLPIAAGYHVAHYFIALLTNGQYAIAALNDPFGRGWQLLGLPDHWVSFGFLTTHSGVQMIWMAQFAVILGAHLLAVLLNLKLTERFPEADGVRAHLPMTLLMIAYTVFGLWLLSSPTAG
ncbi:hypothetical protein QKW60_18700 [Defluviimonas aestuarii]|uniref:hypothetical protein n=1 Tax=Albidovulum aestuarii TaxID=1130726 RepID=UPI00249A5854|nr:hypothetical protein [Defluviimonas aestuarii]MDI3338446.1 hypothetical protein [Defluviimonas aestuarii]